ncbi:MAG: hypothetical protein AB8H03_03510 [Saprospiraceae bacterium]
MKNLHVGKTNELVHSQKWTNSHLHSVVVEEVLNLTYPNFQKLFPFKKEELYQVIFNYFFNDDDAMFYEIENFSNLITACNLKGYKVIIQKNRLTSFSDFDKYMMVKKSKSLDALNQSLGTHEILNDLEKDKVIGGKKQKGWSAIPLNIYFHHHSRTA